MAKINLSKAFTLRKRLRGIISNISNELSNSSTYYFVSKTYPDGQVIESADKPFEFKGLDLTGTYKLLEEAGKNIIILNNLIDEANVISARKVINELEAEKNKIGVIRHLANDRKSYKESVSTYDSTFYMEENKVRGGIVTETYKLSNDDNWEKAVEECKKKILKLEDQLSDINSSTKFEVPDEIINFIDEYF